MLEEGISQTKEVRPERRTLLKGAAWSVPVITAAAATPLAAATVTCQEHDYTLNWTDAEWTNNFVDFANPATAGTATISSTTGGDPVVMNVSTSISNASYSLDNLYGGTYGMTLHMSQAQPGGAITTTFTFSQLVDNLHFPIMDIDAAPTYGWIDTVSISGTPFTYQLVAPTQGAGTVADPFNPSVLDQVAPISPDYNTVWITMPGPLQTFTVVYKNGFPGPHVTVNNHQNIYLGAMNFSTVC